MHYKIIFEAEAEQAIRERAEYIELRSGSTTSEQFVTGIYAFCESLSVFPNRGKARNDLRENMRITNYKGTSVIPYKVNEKNKTVHILDVIHSAQDYENVLKEPN
jgi:plasmid stabilization system protein ParE